MTETYVPRKKYALAFSIVLLVLCVFLGYMLIDTPISRWKGGAATYFLFPFPFGVVFILLGIFCIIGSISNLFSQKYGVYFNEMGFEVYSFFWPYGFVKWQDISEISIVDIPIYNYIPKLNIKIKMGTHTNVIFKLNDIQVISTKRSTLEMFQIKFTQIFYKGAIFLAIKPWFGSVDFCEKLIDAYYRRSVKIA